MKINKNISFFSVPKAMMLKVNDVTEEHISKDYEVSMTLVNLSVGSKDV